MGCDAASGVADQECYVFAFGLVAPYAQIDVFVSVALFFFCYAAALVAAECAYGEAGVVGDVLPVD